MSGKEARAELLKLAEENPKLAEKVLEIAKKQSTEMTYTETQLKSLGVANGARAEFIFNKLQTFATNKEKRDYLADLAEKKIVTEEVLKQVLQKEGEK
jgi:coenzyme F420-reducing hydrogenase alpha subunit